MGDHNGGSCVGLVRVAIDSMPAFRFPYVDQFPELPSQRLPCTSLQAAPAVHAGAARPGLVTCPPSRPPCRPKPVILALLRWWVRDEDECRRHRPSASCWVASAVCASAELRNTRAADAAHGTVARRSVLVMAGASLAAEKEAAALSPSKRSTGQRSAKSAKAPRWPTKVRPHRRWSSAGHRGHSA